MWVLILSSIISSIISFILTKLLIPFFRRNGIIALDLHKEGKPMVANSGGIPVFFSMLMGLMFFIAVQTFVYNNTNGLIYLFAAILTIFLIVIVGFFDDLNVKEVLEGKREIRKGLKQWQKPLLTLPCAIPLMVVKAGCTSMSIPFLGPFDFGILYPLLLVPIGVVGAASAVNLLGGFNGSEAGMGTVYCLTLGLFSLLNGQTITAAIFLSAFGALIGFLSHNWCPARMLSGDSLTYGLGAIVASGVIVGNMEKAGIAVLTPFMLELILKLRSGLKAQCMGKLRKDGKLDPPYGKRIYSLTHVIMNIRPMTEKQVTLCLILLEIIVCSLFFIPRFI